MKINLKLKNKNITIKYDNKKYLVGSKYFFNLYDDYIPKDTDYIVLAESSDDFFKYNFQLKTLIKTTDDVFYYKKQTADEFVKSTLEQNDPLQLGKFLSKEFVSDIGFTIEHLKQLKPLLKKLDDKHKYQIIIYNAYIDNNDFILTDEQRLKAYTEYKKYRSLN